MPGLAAIANEAPFSLHRVQTLDDAVSDLGWSEDGASLLIGSASGSLYRLDDRGNTIVSWRGHDGGVTRICLQPGDRQTLASAGEDGRIRLWDLHRGTQRALLAEEDDWVEHLAWTPDGSVLAAAARKTISLWQDCESLGLWYEAQRQILAMAWAPDSRRLATAANKGLYLWRMDDGANGATEAVQLLSFPGAPVAVAWHARGQALAVGTQDGFLQVWRPADRHGKARQLTMRGYPGKVRCLAWHPRQMLIATAGGPDVVLWRLPPGAGSARGQALRHHQAAITALAWSADGQLLASGDRAGRLCLWDPQGQLLFTRQLGHEIPMIAWQPGRALLAVGDVDGGLHLLSPQHPDSRPAPASRSVQTSHIEAPGDPQPGRTDDESHPAAKRH